MYAKILALGLLVAAVAVTGCNRPAGTPKADDKKTEGTKEAAKKGDRGTEHVLREGIYEATADGWTIHVALAGKPVPKRFLELNKPVEGVDGCEWLVGRCKIQGK